MPGCGKCPPIKKPPGIPSIGQIKNGNPAFGHLTAQFGSVKGPTTQAAFGHLKSKGAQIGHLKGHKVHGQGGCKKCGGGINPAGPKVR